MQVSALTYYPIKSCGSTSVQAADLDACGIVNDRRLLVTDPEGMFFTQREHPKMALIQPHIDGDRLTVSAPGMDELAIDIGSDGKPLQVQIWRSTCQAVEQGDAIADWFSTYLGTPSRLVAMAPGFKRPVNPAFARSPEDQVSFPDGYPLLLIAEASLDDLNARLDTPLPMNRFRPNIVISGADAFAEHDWRTWQIGDVKFASVKPCVRCVVTTTDQVTLERGDEPLRTLARYRRNGEGVIFGQNLIHMERGTLRVGDPVTAS